MKSSILVEDIMFQSKETYFARCAELEKLKKETNVNAKEVSKVGCLISDSIPFTFFQ